MALRNIDDEAPTIPEAPAPVRSTRVTAPQKSVTASVTAPRPSVTASAFLSDAEAADLVRIGSANPAELARLLEVASLSSSCVAERIRKGIDRSRSLCTLAHGTDDALRARARLIVSPPRETGSETREQSAGDTKSETDHSSETIDTPMLADAIVGLDVAKGGRIVLARLSLTTPSGFGAIGATAERFAQGVATRSKRGGALLAVDRRDDGSEHLYGVALTNDVEREVSEWCELTGAANHSQGRKPVTGWPQHVTGSSAMLRENLTRPPPSRGLLEYAFKPWPVGQGARDLRRDVHASGPLADVWASLRTSGGIRVAGASADASQGPSRARESSRVSGESSRDVGCAYCGEPLPTNRRTDSLYCPGKTIGGGSACRSAASRKRAREEKR
jgi:hypothetical protein